MKHRLAICIAGVVLFLGGPVFAQAGAATKTVSASGGSVTFTAAVRNAKTCGWSSSPTIAGFAATVRCKTGTVARSARFKANTSTTAKSYAITLIVRGTSTTVHHWNVDQAGKTPLTSYNGNYNDTLIGVVTVTAVTAYSAESVGTTDGITAPGGAAVINGEFWAVSQGTSPAGQWSVYGITNIPTPIPADGIVGGLGLNTFYLNDPNWNASSASFNDGTCSPFVMQFSSAGATSTTITCEGGYDVYNDTLNFVGTLTLSPCYIPGSIYNASDATTLCNH